MGRTLALLVPPALLLGVFFAWPLARTLEAAASGTAAWVWAATHPYVQTRVGTAFVQAFLSVGLTMALALPLAWFHHSRHIAFGRLQMAVHAAPFVLPVFVVIFGVQAVLGTNGWVHDATGLDLLDALGPMGAVVIAHAYYNYGFAARLLHAALERRPHRLEDAARVLGAPARQAFRRVTLPLVLPSALAVALLVFLFAFTSFGVVLYMGGGRVATLETLLYENLGGILPRYDRAAVLGIAQIAVNLLLLAGYATLWRRIANQPRDPTRVAPRAAVSGTLASWVLLAAALLPAVSVLAGGFQVADRWSLEAWRALLDAGHPRHLGGFHLPRAVGLSLSYAIIATLSSLLLTLLLAYGLRRLGGAWRRVVEVVAALPLGTSSLLIGFGYLLAFGAGALLDLRGTFAVVVVAHTLVAFPFTARALLPALDGLDRRLDEVALLLGARPLAVLARVHWPQLRTSVVAAAGLAAAVSLGDFGASLLLMTPDTMGLSVWIDRHGGVGTFDPLLRAQSIALAGLLMVLAAGAYMAVEAFRRPGEGAL